MDAQTGLYYVRARWYDPFLGRFMSEDPIGLEGGINQYAYALNDPVNLSDPTGLWTCDRNDVANECANGATLPGITVTVQRGPNSGFSAFLFRSRGTSFGAGIVIGGSNDDGSGPQVPPRESGADDGMREVGACTMKVLLAGAIVALDLTGAGLLIDAGSFFFKHRKKLGTDFARSLAIRNFRTGLVLGGVAPTSLNVTGTTTPPGRELQRKGSASLRRRVRPRRRRRRRRRRCGSDVRETLLNERFNSCRRPTWTSRGGSRVP